MTEPETIQDAITTVDEVDIILTSLTSNAVAIFNNKEQINMWLEIRLDLTENRKD